MVRRIAHIIVDPGDALPPDYVHANLLRAELVPHHTQLFPKSPDQETVYRLSIWWWLDK